MIKTPIPHLPFSLVLWWWGMRGCAHIGAYKALEEQQMKPSEIVGASIGALVWAFFAVWLSADEVAHIVQSIPRSILLKPDLRTGLLSQKPIRQFLTEFLGQNTNIEDTLIPLKIVITNSITGQKEIRTSGNLIESLLASASLPAIFPPVKINNIPYIDGWVSDNLPISEASYQNIIAISVIADTLREPKVRSKLPLEVFTMRRAYEDLMRAFRILLVSREQYLIAHTPQCRFLTPPVGDVGLLDLRRAHHAIDIGYQYTKEILWSLHQ